LLIEATWMWRSRDEYAQKIFNRLLGKSASLRRLLLLLPENLLSYSGDFQLKKEPIEK